MNLPGSLIHSCPKLEWSKVPFGTDCLSGRTAGFSLRDPGGQRGRELSGDLCGGVDASPSHAPR